MYLTYFYVVSARRYKLASYSKIRVKMKFMLCYELSRGFWGYSE